MLYEVITKQKAIQKLDKFTVKIAYPDVWEDYSELMIKEGNTYAENMMALSDWNLKDNISKINKPVDRITSYNVCYTKLLRVLNKWQMELMSC